MIKREFYEQKMREAIALLDSKISKNTIELIYDRIKANFTHDDLSYAVEEAITAGNLSFPFLLRQLYHFSSIRIEKEQQEEKRKEEADARRFWQTNYKYIKDGICTRNCYECKVVYCDIIASYSIKAIRSILNREIPVKDAMTSLSKNFKGIGFEIDNPIEPF